MNDYAVPRHDIAIAEMLDHEAFNLRTGASRGPVVAAQLRRIADVVERKI